jgi:hypothetical protein
VRLSKPPPGDAYRATKLLYDESYDQPDPVSPGQLLPLCVGHNVTLDAPCYADSGWLLSDQAGWPGGMPDEMIESMRSVCWLKVRHRKNLVEEWRNALRWRRDHTPVGYIALARFETAAHWHLCPGVDGCTCPPGYAAWFSDRVLFGDNGAPSWLFYEAASQIESSPSTVR